MMHTLLKFQRFLQKPNSKNKKLILKNLHGELSNNILMYENNYDFYRICMLFSSRRWLQIWSLCND